MISQTLSVLFLSVSTFFGGGRAERCESIAHDVGAAMEVAQAQVVAAADDLPAFCRVKGTVHPGIGFEARLPVENWNRKYFQSGCGGFCGVVLADKEGLSNSINPALRRGYAVMTTDSGHQSAHLGDAKWAYHNDVAERQYADESIARSFAAGQALTKAFYRKRPKYSYFSGCSNGGRMAAIAAQRYPDLFDGIISGCPVLNLSRAGGVFGAWVLQANSGVDGEPILDESFSSKVPLLEKAVLQQCDALDGAIDGLVAAPFDCTMDVSALPRCNNFPSDDCLTEVEASIIAKWWRGPRDSRGNVLFGGVPPGSERFWPVWYLGSKESPRVGTMLADGYLKYLGFENDDPARAAVDFDFDHDVQRLEAKAVVFDAMDADLSAFRDAGGKMIMWHGLADPLVIPDQSVGYYRSVADQMGGDVAVQEFFRLFLAPGLGHCWEAPGAGPDDFDPLSALELWVEQGVGPDEIIASPSKLQAGIVTTQSALRPYPAKPRVAADNSDR